MFPAAMQAPLARAIGEPVEVTARPVWPTPDLPKVVDRWMAEIQPELVVFPIGSFWFLYESTPVRVERRLGRPGRWVNRASQKLAAKKWLAHNRPFQWLRRRTQRTLGGDSWFAPEEVIATAKEVIRTILRYEGSYLVVFCPSGGDRWAPDEGALARFARKRDLVDRAISAFCAEHHIEYWDEARIAPERDPRPPSLQGDQLHLDRGGHRRAAERYMDMSVGMMKRALAHSRGEPTEGEST
jgi:hypothetical protein